MGRGYCRNGRGFGRLAGSVGVWSRDRLASVSPWTTTATGLKAVGVGTAFWFLLVTLWSFALGGYLAARLRHRWSDATPAEVRFRNSAHGLLVWALSVLIAAGLAASGVSRHWSRSRDCCRQCSRRGRPGHGNDGFALRSSNATPSLQTADARSEVSRLLLRSAGKGEASSADRTYLAQLVSSYRHIASRC